MTMKWFEHSSVLSNVATTAIGTLNETLDLTVDLPSTSPWNASLVWFVRELFASNAVALGYEYE